MKKMKNVVFPKNSALRICASLPTQSGYFLGISAGQRYYYEHAKSKLRNIYVYWI